MNNLVKSMSKEASEAFCELRAANTLMFDAINEIRHDWDNWLIDHDQYPLMCQAITTIEDTE